ncbi:MAG: PCMD domain-containing protein, partial [Muribaculaceae bacterium]|nr:PCMD domain-containing protein [Muribaculaceae bacterium]
RGYEPFDVTKGSTNNVVLNCKIQNVVVSINTNSIDPNLMKDDYKITISTRRGSLEFTKENASDAKGYFMLPIKNVSPEEEESQTASANNEPIYDDTALDDNSLVFTITGSRKDGKPFSKSGKINNVKRAHQYILNFAYNPDTPDKASEGAAFIKIHVKDEDLKGTENVTVHTRPTITGVDFDITKQLVLTSDENIPDVISMQLCGFGGLKSLYVESESGSAIGLPASDLNLFDSNETQLQAYENAGFELTLPKYKETTNVATASLKIHKSMLQKLSKDQDTEHVIKLTITDNDETPQTAEAYIRIARNEGAITVEDPIVIDPIEPNKDFMSITPHSVTLSYSLSEGYEGNPGVEYCKANENNWKFVAANTRTRSAEKYPLTISGLEEATEYKYRAACGDFHSTDVMTFTTESKFIIPNASFEEWSSYKASTLLGTKTVTLPGSTGDKETSFWGSGNEGAATANMILTDKSTAMKHSGQYSASLSSKSAMGVIAAGNIFTGSYVKTDGTNGVLSVGRAYNGSHPAKLKVYANYRPASGVSVKSGNEKFVPSDFSGGNDHGQIYVALTTDAVEIRTNPNNRKLFDQNDQVVLAYGEVTWTDNFGPDGGLQEIEIPFEYNDRAKKAKPTHLVIVCSASKYGDYFSGSAGSVMYVDDFELIYE